MIWREVIKGILMPMQMTWSYIDTKGEMTSAEKHQAKYSTMRVPFDFSSVQLFEGHALAKVPELHHEFVSEVAHNTIFTFDQPLALTKFSELLNAQLIRDPALRDGVHVAVRLFHSDLDYAGMSRWKKWARAHGRYYWAGDHVGEWVKVMRTLPEGVTIHLVLWRPWLDNESLREVTKPLRDRGAERLRVAVQRRNWRRIPNLEMHFKLTCDLKYDTLRLDIGEAEAKVLSEHGCGGFRGLS
jgi:hypothetical protein